MMDDDDSVSSVSDGSSSPSDIADGVPGSDDATETSSKSWFEKIIDSLKAIVFGLIIVVGSGVLMFWNEGRSAQTAASLAEGAGLVQSVNSDKLDPALDGKLIHVAAPATTARPIRDPDFGVEANGLILARKVEMYQWKEDKKSETRKKLGGGEETVTTYSYSKEWSDKAVDSSRFRNASDHRNSAMPRTLSHEFKAPDAKLGAFALNERVLGLLSASEALEAQPSALTQARAVLGQSAQVRQGTVYAGANPDQPAIGDVRDMEAAAADGHQRRRAADAGDLRTLSHIEWTRGAACRNRRTAGGVDVQARAGNQRAAHLDSARRRSPADVHRLPADADVTRSARRPHPLRRRPDRRRRLAVVVARHPDRRASHHRVRMVLLPAAGGGGRTPRRRRARCRRAHADAQTCRRGAAGFHDAGGAPASFLAGASMARKLPGAAE